MEEIKENLEQEKKPHLKILPIVAVVLLGILLIIITCSLGATGYSIYKSWQTSIEETASANEPLPGELNSAQGRMKLFEKFREPFNEQDNENLFALLDPLAQAEIAREEFDRQISLLYQFAGNINSGVYSHYEYKGIANEKKWFVVYYSIQTDIRTAMLSITITQADQEPYTIWEFHMDPQQ